MGNAYTLLAAMLTMKPWDDIVTAAQTTGGNSVDNLKMNTSQVVNVIFLLKL